MIYEVRDYHFDPDLLDSYRAWAVEALVVLRKNMDVIGFWVDAGLEPRITGTDPIEAPIGVANVTWIIAWDSIEQRDTRWEELRVSEAWLALKAKHPDPDGYRQISARFMDLLTI